MAIREDVVASAAKFLQDPSVAASPIENRIAFLTAKNLTQDEVHAALARAGSGLAPLSPSVSSAAGPGRPYNGQYPPQYPPWAWQQHQQHQHHPQRPPPPPPRRDWRDYFIVATVVGGVSYGLYQLGKRYVYPLIAPPTPDRLETDKRSIDDQFERAFTLVDQLSKDTEALKAAEQERTERLDTALSELETVMNDLKAANRRREDDAQRMRDDVQSLKDSLPKALENQKDMADSRLREVNAELKSLKTLISQRMSPTATSASINSYLNPAPGTSTNAAGTNASASAGTPPSAATGTNGSPGGPATIGNLYGAKPASLGSAAPSAPGGFGNMLGGGGSTPSAGDGKGKAGAGADEPSGISIGLQKRHTIALGPNSAERKSPFSSSLTQPMSIPAWQIAPKSSASTAAPDGATATTTNETGNATS